DNMLRVIVPVEREGVRYGWLAMYWPSVETDNKVTAIIIGGVFLYLVFTCVVGFILYHAYKKDKSNYKLAYYDSLTGLPNRSFLKEHLEAVYDLNPASYSAFIVVNCVNLSSIISTYGYSFGDEIIKQFANILNQVLAKDDNLYRFSSERFVILVDFQKTDEHKKDLTNRIVNTFKQPLVLENAQQYVSIEVGVVELDGHQKEVSQILQEASITLSFLREKNLKVGMYNAQMEAYVKNEELIEHVIRRAISKSPEVSMSMVYQPLVNISEGKIVGFEALLRVSTDSGLVISPQAIIAVAEKKQLIYELGNQILIDVCQFINRINNAGVHNIRVAVNISGIQLLREEFIDSINSIIQVSDIDSSNLEFEITESVLLDNLE
ncbi:MAG: diguanylate cyclase, partial [Ignavibacteria bacterium]|nr:diguanylate cyclase [Ignavibacteria bacterium]